MWVRSSRGAHIEISFLRPRDGGEHLAQDLDPRLARLGQRGLDDLVLMPSIFRSSWMPVMPFCVPAILKSMSPKWSSSPMMSVSSVHLLVALLDQADGDAGHRIADRHAGGHQAQRGAADAGHRTGAVRLENVGDHADRVGELFGIGQHGLDAPLGQGAVADFAPAGTANRPHFADRERGEVVVEHELLGILVDQAVHALLVAAGAQGDGDQRLRLAALEDGRAVHARQHVDLAVDRPQRLAVAAVGPRARQNQVADDVLFQVVPGTAEGIDARSRRVGRIGNQLGAGALLELPTRRRPGRACPTVCLAGLKSS